MSVHELQKFTAVSKYARHLAHLNRRETWGETVARSKEMMQGKYPGRADRIERLYNEFVLPMRVLPSMRGMQFGGPPVLKHMARLYNCSSSCIDRLSFFGQAFYLLLCGAGVGYSVQERHLRHLPCFSRARVAGRVLPRKRFVVPDTIEGWADCAHVQLTSFHDRPVPGFEEYLDCDVEFDYSLVRAKGAPLSYGVGRAPGPEPLAKAMERNGDLLRRAIDSGAKRLNSVTASDYHLNNSDAVVSGGVRRSANLALFDLHDQDMVAYKTGNWFAENPQRGRANISAMLLRGQVSWDDFNHLFDATRQFGEPGFYWSNEPDAVPNPCFRGSTRLATAHGLIRIDELHRCGGDHRVVCDHRAGTGDTLLLDGTIGVVVREASPVELTQKDATIYRLTTEHGYYVDATDTHEFPTTRGRLKLKDIVVGDTLLLQSAEGRFGYFGDHQYGLSVGAYAAESYDVDENVWLGTRDFVRGFVQRVFLDLGEIVYGRAVSLRLSHRSLAFLQSFQSVLLNCGVVSRLGDKDLTVDHANVVELLRFGGLAGEQFEALNGLLNAIGRPHVDRETYLTKVASVERVATEDVYCLFESQTNTVIANGIVAGQCVEIGMVPRLRLNKDGASLPQLLRNYDGPVISEHGTVELSGFQMCNLSTQNGKVVTTADDLYELSDAAAELGTYQAGFDEFPYLGPITEAIVRREALLGVSIAGVMHKPEVMLQPEVLREAARRVRERNEETAAAINIEPAARLTCIKPDGNSASTLGCFSGCHPGKIRRGFRISQTNRTDAVYQYFREHNAEACEESAWSPNKTDDVVRFCVEYYGLLEDDMTAVQFLEHVRTLQKHWVEPGTVRERCVRTGVHHNVSVTCKVRENEWVGVARHIFDHQNDFGGVSFIGSHGDRDYAQAPFTPVFTVSELCELYGRRPLIQAATVLKHHCPGGPSHILWQWCDVALGIAPASQESESFVRAVGYLTKGHFDGDVRKAVYAVKDCYNYRLHHKLKRAYRPVDYSLMREEVSGVDFQGEVACAAGACSL